MNAFRVWVGVSFIIFLLSVAPARGDLLNGSFETFSTSGAGVFPQVPPPPFPVFYTYTGGAAALPGWQITGHSIDLHPSTFWQLPPGGGTQSVDLIGTIVTGPEVPQIGGVSQTISGLTIGNYYKVDFWHTVNPAGDNYDDQSKPKILDVAVFDDVNNALMLTASGSGSSLANKHVQYTMSNGTRTFTDMQWIEDFITFQSPSSSATIAFSGAENPNPSLTPYLTGPVLDEVTFADLGTSVPEPSTLVGLAFGFVILCQRRRRCS